MSHEVMLGLISFIGLIAQLVGSMLLVVLFFLLRRGMSRRAYFGAWAWAWVAISGAICALVVRYRVMPNLDIGLASDDPLAIRAMYLAYQLGKMAFFGCLLAGTRMYATGLRTSRFVAVALLTGALWSALSVAIGRHLDPIVLWQTPVAVGTFAACALALLRLPASRRSLGSEVTGTIFALAAALWTVYAVAFSVTLAGHETPLASIVQFNSYIDILVEVLLGFGMVVMLMEDAMREVADAHAELEIAHDQLRRDALVDPLTGAFNRRALAEGIGLGAAKAAFGTVVMVDVDDLKLVNDTFGHRAGDELLRQVVEVLRAELRPTDRVYRWGGDEFLLVMQGAKATDVESRLAATLAAAAPRQVPGAARELPLRASIGAADYAGAEELLRAIERADRAMYEQKNRRKTGPVAAISAH